MRASPALSNWEIVGSVVIPASIVRWRIAATKVSPEPTARKRVSPGFTPLVMSR